MAAITLKAAAIVVLADNAALEAGIREAHELMASLDIDASRLFDSADVDLSTHR